MADKNEDDWLTGGNKLDGSLILDDPWSDGQPDEITGNQPVDKMNSHEDEKSSNQMAGQSDTQETESATAEAPDTSESQSVDFSSEQSDDSIDIHTDVQSDTQLDEQTIPHANENMSNHTDEVDPFEEFSKTGNFDDSSPEQAVDFSSAPANEKTSNQPDTDPFEVLDSLSLEQTMPHADEETSAQSDDFSDTQPAVNSYGQADNNNPDSIDPDSIGFDFDTDEPPEAEPEPFTASQPSENPDKQFHSQTDSQSHDFPDAQQDEITGSQPPAQSETHIADKTGESTDPFDIWDDMTDDHADNLSSVQPDENAAGRSHDQNADIWGDSIWGDEQPDTAGTESAAPAGGAADDFWDAVQGAGQRPTTQPIMQMFSQTIMQMTSHLVILLMPQSIRQARTPKPMISGTLETREPINSQLA